MSSMPVIPTTVGEADAAVSSLPSSPPSSAPSDSPPAQAYNDVTEAMVAEEKRMKQASKAKERNARKRAQREWKDAAEDQDTVQKQLNYLVNKAKVSYNQTCPIQTVALYHIQGYR